MNQLIDKILDLPKLQRIAILGVIIILAGAAYYSFLHLPLSDEIAKLTDSVEIAKSEKLTKSTKAANLARLRKDLANLDLQLKKAVAQLPDRKEVADLLSSITTKAQGAGLDVLTFRPRAEALREFYAEVPVDITVKGNYHEMIDFFDNVGRLDRLINIDNIGFKNPTITGERVIVETTTVATAYRFLNEAERKKVAEDRAAAEAKAKAKK